MSFLFAHTCLWIFSIPRYMQSFQDILKFKDKNADNEKVTHEWVVFTSGPVLVLHIPPVTGFWSGSQMQSSKSETATTMWFPPWLKASWSIRKPTAPTQSSARTFSIFWIGFTWVEYPSGCCWTSTVSETFANRTLRCSPHCCIAQKHVEVNSNEGGKQRLEKHKIIKTDETSTRENKKSEFREKVGLIWHHDDWHFY